MKILCPKCDAEMVENPKEEGCWFCPHEKCLGVFMTPECEQRFLEALQEEWVKRN